MTTRQISTIVGAASVFIVSILGGVWILKIDAMLAALVGAVLGFAVLVAGFYFRPHPKVYIGTQLVVATGMVPLALFAVKRSDIVTAVAAIFTIAMSLVGALYQMRAMRRTRSDTTFGPINRGA